MLDNNYIFIGDNYDVMSSDDFQNFKNHIDFIYIDPPYNTKNKFSFNDKNDEWYSDIHKRLFIAKQYLNKEGVIFISIDDKELTSLLLACYDVFGKENFAGMFITKQSLRSNSKQINVIHEYILCFCKNKKFAPKFYIKRIADPSESKGIKQIIKCVKKEFNANGKDSAKNMLGKLIKNYCINNNATWIKNYNNIDEKGNIYFAKDLSTPGKARTVNIPSINLHLDPLPSRGWSSDAKFIQLYKKNRLCFKAGRPYEIEYLDEAVNNITSILDFYSRQGTNDLKKLGLEGIFDTPKPVEMIKFLIRSTLHKDGVILDFYAGSGTTAQSVYEINSEDNFNHKYILIQRKENLNSKSDVYKKAIELGFSNPSVDDLMLLRINTFLKLKKLPKNYRLIDKGEH